MAVGCLGQSKPIEDKWTNQNIIRSRLVRSMCDVVIASYQVSELSRILKFSTTAQAERAEILWTLTAILEKSSA